MSVFTLDKEHPLTRAGLRFIHVVEKVELGLKPGDVVFEFPYGRIVDTGMACRRERIIPPDVEIMTIHKEALPLGHPATSKGKTGNTLTSWGLGGRFRPNRGGVEGWPLVLGLHNLDPAKRLHSAFSFTSDGTSVDIRREFPPLCC